MDIVKVRFCSCLCVLSSSILLTLTDTIALLPWPSTRCSIYRPVVHSLHSRVLVLAVWLHRLLSVVWIYAVFAVPALATDCRFRWEFFFSVTTMTHEPLHLPVARCNFAATCTSTTSRTLLNFKVIGQRSRSHEFFWCFPVCIMLRLPTASTWARLDDVVS